MEQASKAFKRASVALLSHGRPIPYQLFNNWGVVEHRYEAALRVYRGPLPPPPPH